MRLVAYSSVENGQNNLIFCMLSEMQGAPLSCLTQITNVTNTFVSSVVLVLHYVYVQAGKEFDCLKKVSFTGEYIYIITATVGATFSMTPEQRSETTYRQC